MISKKVVVKLKFGLHARPAGVLAGIAQKYQSDVKMQTSQKSINAKSVMGVLSAGVKYGEEVEIICDGTDEETALKEIATAVDNGLGEK